MIRPIVDEPPTAAPSKKLQIANLDDIKHIGFGLVELSINLDINLSGAITRFIFEIATRYGENLRKLSIKNVDCNSFHNSQVFYFPKVEELFMDEIIES